MPKNPPGLNICVDFSADEILNLCDYEIAVYSNEVETEYDKGFVDGLRWMKTVFMPFSDEVDI